MLVAMAKDWRVLVIKLADRLHNMRTLSVMPEWKQHRTAQQTLDIYAPLAHRLGIEEMKWQLEDLSFEALHPKRYAEIEKMVATRAPRRETELDQVIDVVRGRLAALGVEATVTGRPKHLWSIYEKMVVRGKEFDEIYDLVGIRIVVDSEKDCWAALGSVHALWPPVQGRFKDYINSPKFNLYQSLHTTVVGAQRQAARDPGPDPGDAPTGRSTASPRTGVTRRSRRSRSTLGRGHGLVPALRRLGAGHP
jgi:guanosine-3',5'-bis(diphosphate) 3'-pyrophosphohydrolase